MDSSSVYALSAGFLAAAGSLSAKLTLGADYLREMCESGLSGWTQGPGGDTRCDWLHVPLRLLCGVLLLSCNTLMWTMFSKALRHGSSSAGVTVTTTASNFISSAVIGRLIFGESHSTLWWTGISLTLCGLLVLHSATPQTSPQEVEKKDK
ncbi:transmembrane protein 42-like [Poeciliopsis prolifica]|uniref:transmembrane protein 42-like n=1 Tax=Poeciliopsis prolifica TaxID=188132 RepID=UPI002413B949|nr:transmembrane protein 42-like [Poeciliopsis prolifica]